MQLKKFKSWLSVFSLLALSACGTTSTPHLVAPNITVCISSPAWGGMECYHSSGKRFFARYFETDNFICMEPDDYGKIIEHCSVAGYKE